jgi:hypothetical protein
VGRASPEGRGGKVLDDPSGVHHQHPLTELADEGNVVADEEDGRPFLVADGAEKIEDLLWMVTSSAVVGSSAMITLEVPMSRRPITARWRMPRDSSWDY